MEGVFRKYNLWVEKEDISGDCIKELNSITIDAASSMLATVPNWAPPFFTRICHGTTYANYGEAEGYIEGWD